jgi:fatty acid desaturase
MSAMSDNTLNPQSSGSRNESLSRSRIWREADGALPNSLALGYAMAGYTLSFFLMSRDGWLLPAVGALLCTHSMVIAAYLIHEAAHFTLFARPGWNRAAGELMNWIAGGAYASFERIRQLHLRHHRDRADVTCFDYKTFLRAHPLIRRLTYALEWAHIPAVEVIMHLQVVLRPVFESSQRKHLPRIILVFVVRVALWCLFAWFSLRAALLYLLAYALLLVVLNFFDAYHHTFEQFFVPADTPVSLDGRDRQYEQANTFSNVVSVSHPLLNLLTLNFGYHNAHHERAAEPWYRLPALNQELFGAATRELMPLSELLRTHHRHRLHRVLDDGYGAVGSGPGRTDHYLGAHAVSFLTVV